MQVLKRGPGKTGKGRTRRRSQTGSAIAETAPALSALVVITAGVVFLLTAAALIIFYKLKLAYIADQTAQRAVIGRYWLGAQRPSYGQGGKDRIAADSIRFARNLLAQAGLDGATDVIIDQSNVRQVKVIIRVRGIPALTQGFLPPALSLSEVAVKSYRVEQIFGVLGWGIQQGPAASGLGQGFISPTYGRGVNMFRGKVTSVRPGPRAQPINTSYVWQTENIPAGRVVRHY